MAARASGKKAKSTAKTARKATTKRAATKGKKKKSAAKATSKKSASPAKATKSSASRKSTTAKARPAAKPGRPAPAGTGELVHTRLLGVAKRLLGPTTTADGESASGHIIHRNPARDAMLKRLFG